ncbi:MAG: DUF99 family protein [Desulfurococcaceae archaeon]
MDRLLIEAYDDGFFPVHCKGGRCGTFIAGVRADKIKVEKVAWTIVKVDLNKTIDAIINLSDLLNGDIIILDGITYAGFDVVDPVKLSRSTSKGVIVIQQYSLNLDRIKEALIKHFADWERRFQVINNVYRDMKYYSTPWRVIKIYTVSVDKETVDKVLKSTLIYSPIPEPLRIADKIASSLSQLLYRY